MSHQHILESISTFYVFRSVQLRDTLVIFDSNRNQLVRDELNFFGTDCTALMVKYRHEQCLTKNRSMADDS